MLRVVCALFAVRCLLFVVRCSLSAVWCSLFVVSWLLCVACCVVCFVGRRSLCVVRCLWLVAIIDVGCLFVGCLFIDDCLLLLVVCCVLRVA